MSGFTNNKAKQDLFEEISNALKTVNYGSVDIIVQGGKVTQISVRNIRKTSLDIEEEKEGYFSVDSAPLKRTKIV